MSRKKLLLRKFSITRPASRVSTLRRLTITERIPRIAAGVTGQSAVVNGVSIDDMSGVAPGAWLGTTTFSPATLRALAAKTS